MTRRTQTTVDYKKLPTLPDSSGTLSGNLGQSSEGTDQVAGTSKPSEALYYKRLATLIHFLQFFIPVVIVLMGAVIGFYVYQLRDPLIRLEESYKNLQREIDKVSIFNEEVKKFMYSNGYTGTSSPSATNR